MTVTYYGLNGLMLAAHAATNGMFGAILPFVIFIITLAVTGHYGINKSFSTAGFLAFCAALPLFAMGITPGFVMVIITALALAGLFIVSRG